MGELLFRRKVATVGSLWQPQYRCDSGADSAQMCVLGATRPAGYTPTCQVGILILMLVLWISGRRHATSAQLGC